MISRSERYGAANAKKTTVLKIPLRRFPVAFFAGNRF